MHFYQLILNLVLCIIICLCKAKNDECKGMKFTKADQEGPFFVENVPVTTKKFSKIAPDAERKDPMKKLAIKGQVYDRNCVPVMDAVVDVWYAGECSQGCKQNYTFPPEKLWYRGKFKTGKV